MASDLAPDHVVTVKHADGSETEITIRGAKEQDLGDPEFVIGVCTGDWDPWLIKQQGSTP
ncbi:hypothetical protein ACH79_16410 [Bradyrhizobium sp. CCBAU 051011]|uniref:hypothetical protein n=1 Tax=Bradyrhizobium sp. CCBAU 051011 TaxID=858422 RepID=UPI001373D568|nr:hypothetical protein [Bradyrhizobium sp. CCBAU 051011]QHO73978.1 hypothetical protein ACH79_16410 [Bradyrhizobium sp. CCBAU 051011]